MEITVYTNNIHTCMYRHVYTYKHVNNVLKTILFAVDKKYVVFKQIQFQIFVCIIYYSATKIRHLCVYVNLLIVKIFEKCEANFTPILIYISLLNLDI